jgi:hypothetical protein
MPLSQADIEDIRRFAGYPVAAAMMFQDVELAAYSAQLDLILAGLTESQIAALQASYLTPLRTLESAIPAAGQNLDTDRAAVWYHNKSEIQDRVDLFMITRRSMCFFMGIPPGAGVSPLVPAVFTV